MALYPGQENDRRVDAETLTEAVAAIFAACSMSAKDARTVADSLVHADLRGIHSHGVLRVPDYVKKMTKDGVDPRGRPWVARETGGAVRICGDNAMGQIGG
ncbi:MAG: Ldh family oxidoreductase, partial [Rhodospirillaceae bacterium]